MKRHVVIVGGGVGGLTAAIRLAARGVRVSLVERNSLVGGKLNRWEAAHPSGGTFRFDTGPSLLTLPFVFRELFADVGERLKDYLELIALDLIARFQWADGSTFELKSDPIAMRAEVARFAPGSAAGWARFMARSATIWDLSADLFLRHAPEQVLRSSGKFDPVAALKMLSVPFRIGMFRNFAPTVDRYVADRRLREVLYQYATYSGASPFKAPATLAVIPHAEMHFGGWYPRGGMYAIASALERVARKLGVEIRTGCAVERILVDGTPGSKKAKPQAAGVRLASGEPIHADAVVANCDVVYAYRNLIDGAYRRKYDDRTLDRLEPGGSGMVLLLGVDGAYPQLAHHTKFMPADYTSDLRAMFDTRTIPDDPCIYVCASTRTDPTQAPPGCENLFVLASAPPLQTDGPARATGIDWNVEGPRYRDQLVRTLEEKWGLTDLRRRIVVERRITPVDLRDLYNANAGSIYGISSNGRRNAFLRPPNRDRDVRGLYFAGGATHPGGGLPLVALSGKIVSDLIAEDFQGR